MSRRAWAVTGSVMWVIAACASGDPAPSDTARSAQGGYAPAGQGGVAGSGSVTASPTVFDNSQAQTPALPPVSAEDTACVVGQFCENTNPDPDDCGSLTLQTDVEVIEHPGNVLLVFDTSGSMAQDWNGQTRWEAAGAAIENALAPLADLLTVGTVFFPRADPNAPAVCVDPTGITCIFLPFLVLPSGTCGVTPITAADQIDFTPGATFLATFTGAANTAPPYAPVPNGLTPLKEGLEQAQAALASSTLDGLTSVIVITDGDPNCEWDAAVSRQIVADWLTQGIRTYVIGLPGTSGTGDAVLRDLAMTGGTGTYITPTDALTLEQQLRMIATETVRVGFNSCEITIDPPAEAPEKLHLVVTEGGVDQDVAPDIDPNGGWSISADGSLVTLEGWLCDDAKSARFEELRFEFGCVDLPPLPPPPPVE